MDNSTIAARPQQAWIYVDGCCKGNPGPCGVGASFKDRHNNEFHTIAANVGMGTNNTAEYKALLRAMWEAREMGIRRLVIHSDSALVVNQVNGNFVCRSTDLLVLYKVVVELVKSFEAVTVLYIPREQNGRADQLANEGYNSEADDKRRRLRVLHGDPTLCDPADPGAPPDFSRPCR